MPVVDPTTAAHHRLYPSVSLLVPVDGAAPWQQRLRSLQREAISRLRAELGEDLEAGLVDRLHRAVEHAAAPPGARSIAVYANAAGADTVGLGVAVRQRAVIDDTFATRDLVHHELRSPRYWLLALTLDDPRLLRGHGSRLRPHPLPVRELAEHPSTGRDPRGRDRTDLLDASRTRRLRALDMALGDAMTATADPLVIVGGEPTLSRFLAVTRHASRIEATVRRTPAHDLAALSRAVAPAVAQVLDARRERALAQLERAVGAGIAVSGLHEVWRAARRTRAALLLVESSIERPAIIDAAGELSLTDDPEAPGVVDDVVDEIIELVLAAHGRVEIVPDGTLAVHQGIVLVPPAARHR